MPRARGKGGKNRKKAKANQDKDKRELEFRTEGQEYGQVTRLLGGGRVECYCMDGKKRTCTIRGSMKNRVWIRAGDIVLLGLREFGDDGKADIMMKYYDEEALELQELEELPDHIRIGETLDGEEMMLGDEEEMGAGAAAAGDDDEEEKVDKDVDIDNI